MERMELIKHYCAVQGLGSRDLIIILHHSDKRVHKLKGNYLSFIKMLREVAHYNNYDMKRLSSSTVHVSVINLQLTPMFGFYRRVWCRGEVQKCWWWIFCIAFDYHHNHLFICHWLMLGHCGVHCSARLSLVIEIGSFISNNHHPDQYCIDILLFCWSYKHMIHSLLYGQYMLP